MKANGEYIELVMVTWRLEQVSSRLREIDSLLGDLADIPPERVHKRAASIRRQLGKIENKVSQLRLEECAYRRRAAGMLTDNEKFDKEHGRPSKPGMDS